MQDASAQGAHYFLLVGGDCSDYRNYLGTGCVSFIPTLYRAAGTGSAFTPFTPSDPALVDFDDNGVPDQIISRLPVRSTAELALVVDKTLLFGTGSYTYDAVFAADAGFGAHGEHFINSLPKGWSVERAYLDHGGVGAARSTLLNALNQGSRLASYVGHSSAWDWTWQKLFRYNDPANLTNVGLPSLVTQWGCNTTYFVEPAYNTMAHTFMLANSPAGPTGAAAVLGASGFTLADAERDLGVLLMPKLVEPGKTVGQALLEAKQELALTHPEYTDVLLGYIILGDAALVLGAE
jgi:hypothetical protein